MDFNRNRIVKNRARKRSGEGKRTACFMILITLTLMSLTLTGCRGPVTRTFPGFLFEDVEAYRQIIGFQSGELQEDGSVCYTFTAEEKDNFLKLYQADAEAKIEELTTGTGAAASIKRIEFSGNFSKVDVYVDPSAYSLFDAAYVLPFLRVGALYRIMNGVDYRKVDVELRFLSSTNEEVIDTTTYQQIFGETD